jgi:hypothetical protein
LTEILEAMVAPDTDGRPSLPRRSTARTMLPSTWLERTVRISYVDAFGSGTESTGALLDWCAVGVILNLAGEKTVVAWDSLRAVTLIND